MKRIHIQTSQSYDVLIEGGLLAQAGELLAERFSPRTAVLLTDTTVDTLYAGQVADALARAGFRVLRYAFAGGESNKTLSTVAEILAFLSQNAVTRSDLLVALGGGIVGDVVGFSAAVYLRGLRFVQIPTTFLAAIDASVGGKTGVNLPTGKNLAGAFWQPACVLCDCETFRTLPRTVFLDGVAEAIKYGVLEDEALFNALAASPEIADIEDVVFRCIQLKSRFVAEDERDVGQRQLLNLGHTLGHAIERVSGYQVSHGHGVAIGMVAAARAAERLGYAKAPCSERIIAALQTHGLPVSTSLPTNALLQAMTRDKKRTGATLNLVLPERIGACGIVPFAVDRLPEFIQAGLEGSV